MTNWVRYARPAPGAHTVLLCFHHAGGAASAYRGWPARLEAQGVEVWPVQLPGRENRRSEPLRTDLAALVGELLDDVRLDRPYALFGHSVGASVAVAVADGAARRGLPAPRRLFLSAHRPMTHPDPDFPIHRLDDDRLLAKLDSYGGLPAFLDPELVALTLPVVRADLTLAETAGWLRAAQLDCPVTVIGGSSDATVPIGLLPAWRALTTGPFEITVLPGGHFRPQAAEDKLLEVLGSALAV